MFTIPIGDLLLSFTGDTREFTFSGPIFDGYYDDLIFGEPLHFTVVLMTLDDGICVQWKDFSTTVTYESKTHTIELSAFERIWKTEIQKGDPDDIRAIDMKNKTIDLAPVIREEIIMECSLNF